MRTTCRTAAAALKPTESKIATKGLIVGGDLVPRQDAHDDAESEHVEQENAHRHRVDGGRHHLLRILGLSSGDADDFDAAEGEHDDGERSEQTPEPVGEEAAVVEQSLRAHLIVVGDAEAEDDDGHAELR
jgi:hypothetical protein